VAVDAGGDQVAIADTNGRCVHLYDLEAQRYGRIDAVGAPPRPFECPVAVAWADDTLWVADSKLAIVVRTSRPWAHRRDGGGTPSGGDAAPTWQPIGEGELVRPAGMAYSAANELVYVVDTAAHSVKAFDRSGVMTLSFGEQGAGPGQFNFPSHVACAPDGTLVVSDSLNFRVQRFDAQGAPMGSFGGKGDAAGDLSLPKGVAVDPDGNVWVVDANFENVQAFTPEGNLLMAMGGEGHEPGEFWLPAGVTIDGRRRMWIADTYNRRVQVFELLE
jgi:DNA-binding beta-propeller fold protein YncE